VGQLGAVEQLATAPIVKSKTNMRANAARGGLSVRGCLTCGEVPDWIRSDSKRR